MTRDNNISAGMIHNMTKLYKEYVYNPENKKEIKKEQIKMLEKTDEYKPKNRPLYK